MNKKANLIKNIMKNQIKLDFYEETLKSNI